MIIDCYRYLNRSLTLMELSEKVAVLILLATAKCPSEIRNLELKKINRKKNNFTFVMDTRAKTSRWNNLDDITIEVEHIKKSYGKTAKYVCPHTTLEEYIHFYDSIHQSSKLFVTTTTGTPVAWVTLTRWTKSVMNKGGIDITFFKGLRKSSNKEASWLQAELFSFFHFFHIIVCMHTTLSCVCTPCCHVCAHNTIVCMHTTLYACTPCHHVCAHHIVCMHTTLLCACTPHCVCAHHAIMCMHTMPSCVCTPHCVCAHHTIVCMHTTSCACTPHQIYIQQSCKKS